MTMLAVTTAVSIDTVLLAAILVMYRDPLQAAPEAAAAAVDSTQENLASHMHARPGHAP